MAFHGAVTDYCVAAHFKPELYLKIIDKAVATFYFWIFSSLVEPKAGNMV
jgi:hypothetical protein